MGTKFDIYVLNLNTVVPDIKVYYRTFSALVFRNITVLLPLGLDYSLNNINTIYIPDTESSFVIDIVVSFIYDTILHCHVLLNNSELILKGVVINWIVILGYFIAIVFIL